MHVETARLIVRDLELEDLDAMVATWVGPDVARFMDDFGPRTQAETADWLPGAIAARDDEPRYGGCAIVRKESGAIVGWIGFGPSSRGVAEISFAYAVAAPFRHDDYASEALSTVVDYCFSHLKVASVWGECRVDNVASRRVMERAGLQPIGEVEGQSRFLIEAPGSGDS